MADNSDVPQGRESGDEQPPTLPDPGGKRRDDNGAAPHGDDGERFLPSLPGYDILERLGRGGSGVVYKAWQFRLKRYVALKMLRDGALADAEQRARFRGEAEAAARLRHPHIVQIHDIGEHEGRPYLALEYVEGGSLARRLSRGPLPLAESVQLVETLARAVHVAHEAGVIHRDLTPANILLAADGSPRISDFGLAKRLDSNATQTYSGAIMGTPSYMAPEQAAGQNKRIGVATDVYALGTILYELLTGRPPFRATSPLETMNLVLFEEPLGPRRLDARLPRDLETICLKCLQKETPRRYASAWELAEDLRRWRSGEPIRARPNPSWERAAKWMRRRPAAAMLLAVLVLAVCGAIAGVVWHTIELERALEYARQQEAEAWQQRQRVLEREEELDRQLHALDVRIAQRLWRNGHLTQALTRLEGHQPAFDADKPARFEWRYLWRICHSDAPVSLPSAGTEALTAVFSPDGKLLAVGHSDGTVHLWRTATRQRRATLHGHEGAIQGLHFTLDGRTLLSVGADRVVCAWDVESAAEVRRFRVPNALARSWLPSPDGRLLATAEEGASVVVRDAAGMKQLWQVAPPEEVEVLAFSGDGRLLACGCRNGSLRLWDADSGREVGWYEHASSLTALALTEDGKVVAAAESNGMVTLHVRSGGQTLRFRSHEGAVRCLAFSPCRTVLVSVGDDNIVRVWQTSTGELRNALRGHRERVNGVAFAPEGGRLATVCRDGVVRLWDPLQRQDHQALFSPATALTRLAWAPDGRLVATASPDRALTLWDADTWSVAGRLIGHFDDIHALAFAPDGRTLASASADHTVQLWDVAQRRIRATLVHASAVRALVFTPDGKTLIAGEESGGIVLCDPVRGVQRRELARHSGPLRCLACSPDGRILASASADRTLHLWRTERWERGPTLEFTDAVAHLAFSPDGRLLVTTQTTGAVALWDSDSGARLHALTGPGSPYESAHVSPDGRTLALVGRNTHVALWDIRNRQEPRLRHGLWDGNEVVDAAFAPSGSVLAMAHRDGRITLWDARDWKSRRACGSALGPVWALAFTANGRRLATVCGTTINWARHTRQMWPARAIHVDSCLPGDCREGLRLWDAATGEPCPILSPQDAIVRPSLLAAAGDGQTLATAQADGNVWLWDLATGKRRAILSTCRQARTWRLSEELIFAGIPARPEQMVPLRALAFAPDSRLLAVLTAGGVVQLWNPVRGVRESVLPGDHRDAACLAFAPDGRTLATHQRGEVELWDIPTRQCRKISLHPGARIRCLAFSSDGRWLASGASDCSVKLWDRRGEREFLLSGHSDSVSSAAFAPDGRTLATGSFDRTVRLWDVATAQEVLCLEGHRGKVHCLAFAPDGHTLASGGETPHGSGEVHLWRAAPE